MSHETLLSTIQHEEEIKRSRFIAIAAPCPNEAAVQAFLAQHSVPEANHNCYAWRIGQTYRFNDDGEPSGTAGKPILQAIDGQGLDQVAVVVIRYFGGIKLGAGGLIRAYGGSAARCLQSGERKVLIEYLEFELSVPFEHLGTLHHALPSFQAEIIEEHYEDQGLRAKIKLPKVEFEGIQRQLKDASGGVLKITPAEANQPG